MPNMSKSPVKYQISTKYYNAGLENLSKSLLVLLIKQENYIIDFKIATSPATKNHLSGSQGTCGMLVP